MYGSPSKRALFSLTNPGLQTGHTFTGNGIFPFDYSQLNYSYYLKKPTLLAQVDWIDGDPLSEGTVTRDRFINSPGNQSCFTIGGIDKTQSFIDR